MSEPKEKLLDAIFEALNYMLMLLPGRGKQLRLNLVKAYSTYKESLAKAEDKLITYEMSVLLRKMEDQETVEQYIDRQKEPIKVVCGDGAVIFNDSALKLGYGNRL